MYMTQPPAIFVYGTLKRGEINHGLLDGYARSIEVGWVLGCLYDVGEFPALAEGKNQVRGEIVRLDPEVMEQVLAVLDRLENCIPGDDANSMYTRRTVEVTTITGAREPAYTYFYNPSHPSLPPLEQLPEVESGEWHGPQENLGVSGSAELEEYRDWVRTFGQKSSFNPQG